MSYDSILFCATGIHHTVGGIASANRNVLKALEVVADEQMCRVEVLTLLEARGACNENYYRAFNGNKLAFSLAMLRAAFRAEIVVFDHVQLAVPLLFLPRFLWPKVVICAHGSEAGKRVRRSSIELFRKADLVVTNSNYTLANMKRYFDRFNGHVCELGLPPQHHETRERGNSSEPIDRMTAANGEQYSLGSRVMLLVARMDAGEREKGHRELIAIMPQLVSEVPAAQLVFVGGGSDEAELRALSAESPAASHIFFSGKISDERLDQLYNQCYSYVMPSRQEGFGLVYLEAMNHAKPCVACRDDGGAEVVVDGETGYLVNQPINLDELTAVLLQLLGSSTDAEKMGRNGLKRLQERYTSSAYQERYSAYIRPLLIT